ncbi:hypothetical protein ACT17_14880 [Mycolicibacterium conceptionense]|uniref:Uncharacterized protein n=1 Tax=Mycolicibacterium conceptionense TaxID=451644 RepID=A0A0J8U7T4_9MYCO|nr:hypothetical protein [Mycolicibacterium conceptionense]KMV17578.1 hypothetical protein ACT17_14880 [Mycolicibacterium conceptionense]
MADEQNTISITSREGFQKALSSLRTYHGQIDGKVKLAEKLSESLSAAAIKGVVASDSTSTSTESGKGTVAPIYSKTLEASDLAVQQVAKQVTAAKSSLAAVITDLEALYKGISGADNKSTSDVKAA